MIFIAFITLLSGLGEVSAAEGQALYQKFCSACHGEYGDGRARAGRALDPPPVDFTSSELSRILTRERMIHSITHGRPGTAMVGWEGRLNRKEIESIADFIREQFMSLGSELEETIEEGKRIYRRHCSACHGDRGSSAMWTQHSLNPPPRDFTSKVARSLLDRTRMLHSVTHGRPGTAMMPFAKRLSSTEIEQVVDYIRSSFMKGKVVSARNTDPAATASHRHGHTPVITGNADESDHPQVDDSKPFPEGLKGDLAEGKRLFLQNCQPCHGKNGDGQGPRARFNRPPPRNFHTAESRIRFNRPELFQAVKNGKTGTVMPAWDTVLGPQEIANVAEYVFVAFIQDESISSVTEGQGSREKKKE